MKCRDQLLVCAVRVAVARILQPTCALVIHNQQTLWRKQESRMRLQETGERKFRLKLRDRDPTLAADYAKIHFQNV